jgi:single-strand DNA-binding protein
MVSFNKVILMGNLTRDPEVRYMPSGVAVVTLGLAVNNKYKKQDGQVKEDVCFVDVSVFDKQAENCGKYLSKGQGVVVDGRLSQRSWEGEDGQKRNKHEVIAQSIQFLPKRSGSQEGGEKGDVFPDEPGDATPF